VKFDISSGNQALTRCAFIDSFRIDDPVVKDGVFPYMGSFRAGFEDPPLQTNLSISRKVWKLLSPRCV